MEDNNIYKQEVENFKQKISEIGGLKNNLEHILDQLNKAEATVRQIDTLIDKSGALNEEIQSNSALNKSSIEKYNLEFKKIIEEVNKCNDKISDCLDTYEKYNREQCNNIVNVIEKKATTDSASIESLVLKVSDHLNEVEKQLKTFSNENNSTFEKGISLHLEMLNQEVQEIRKVRDEIKKEQTSITEEIKAIKADITNFTINNDQKLKINFLINGAALIGVIVLIILTFVK